MTILDRGGVVADKKVVLSIRTMNDNTLVRITYEESILMLTS